ncbi:MAG: ArsC/Spx/MgsR family protein [Flavobacteriaceae bacterium]|nr:ArsC/Spx/MgsR family protein [Flavobacteriaceae bacterium]
MLRALNLSENFIKEDDYKKLLLEHCTFLKRPILIN